jgi:cytochrome c-type biogenesis protein CcmH/NrfF
MLKRSLHIVILIIAGLSMLGAGAATDRFDKVGHKLMCGCGCSQILLECNHVGCPVSPVMIGELHSQIDAGTPEAGILTWFADKYGPTVLAAPFRDNFFDRSTWYIPGGVLVLGIVGVMFLVRRWRARVPAHAPAVDGPPASDAMRERIRRETEY